ncbi:MAG: GNAT family N-acetyltransferase [Bacteroidales bacterium]|nr:GNAT family N-acetyltransferase [Bacteroidales bacterium]
MDTIKIEKYQKGQETEIYQLIKRVYDEFVSYEYTMEGNQFFYDWIQPDKIAQRQAENRNMLTATSGIKIVGVIEIRDNNRISLLFVDKEYQGQGIAKRLFHESLKFLIQNDSAPGKFYVHASPCSIPIYKKLGFIETESLQENHGIKYMPMEKKIKK